MKEQHRKPSSSREFHVGGNQILKTTEQSVAETGRDKEQRVGGPGDPKWVVKRRATERRGLDPFS